MFGKDRFLMKERFHGYYATRIYLPLSGLSRQWRRFSRQIRGKPDPFLQNIQLPEVSWKVCTKQRSIKIWETEEENGNVRISELAILSAIAADCRDGTNLFEIGTFNGRTTLNLALNSPAQCEVFTLDLPPDLETLSSFAEGERQIIKRPKPGSKYEKYKEIYPAEVGRIHQLFGDSSAYDYSPHKGSCSFVFVDGSHAYDYVLSDTRAVMDMVCRDGVIIWHDYGIWEDVTKALEELEQRENYGLRNISGTSLVYWKKA
jgi:hypothetical protein